MCMEPRGRPAKLPGTETAFGAWLRDERKRRGWSGEMLAFRADTTQSIVSAIERGTRGATRDMAERLARALASDFATAEEIEQITADALLSAGFVPPGGLPDATRTFTEEAFFGYLETYDGPDARIKAIRGVAELLHEGTATTASRPAATPTDSRYRPLPTGYRLDTAEPAATLSATDARARQTGTLAQPLARTLEAYIPSGDFSGLTASDLDQAMAVAFAEAEKMAVREFKNVYDNRFRQEAQMLLEKQGRGLAALDRPLPPPAQKESVLDDVLGGE
jgi:transcriptional regulator with XRE-family HTH domain